MTPLDWLARAIVAAVLVAFLALFVAWFVEAWVRAVMVLGLIGALGLIVWAFNRVFQ